MFRDNIHTFTLLVGCLCPLLSWEKKKKKKQENHLDATRERQVTPLNSEEDAFSLNVILSMAYSKLYCESGPNKMAPLASILSEREQ